MDTNQKLAQVSCIKKPNNQTTQLCFKSLRYRYKKPASKFFMQESRASFWKQILERVTVTLLIFLTSNFRGTGYILQYCHKYEKKTTG